PMGPEKTLLELRRYRDSLTALVGPAGDRYFAVTTLVDRVDDVSGDSCDEENYPSDRRADDEQDCPGRRAFHHSPMYSLWISSLLARSSREPPSYSILPCTIT